MTTGRRTARPAGFAGTCAGIVPPYLLEHLAEHVHDDLADRLRAALVLDATHRTRRGATQQLLAPPATGGASVRRDDGTAPLRQVRDAHGTQDLPGDVVREEGGEPTGDRAADEAYDGLGATWSLYRQAYGRDSLDDKGLGLDATVHYGTDYDNAFWDGTQMVFGDGDGVVFRRFTIAVDVIGHELTHGVTELTAGLEYQGQSGALNESVSDVFGSLVKQRQLGQDAASADWLIGEGLFTPDVQGVALRSMKAPGTAYDDDRLGHDPQPATMAGYVETSDDNGGVHMNSGIPNHAFYLAAAAIGGHAWQAPGQIWYDVLTGGSLPSDADFATFAQATVDAAGRRFGAESTQSRAVLEAWRQVGVLQAGTRKGSADAGSTDSPAGSEAHAPVVVVERTGGFAGIPKSRDVDLRSLPSEEAERWRALLESAFLRQLSPERPQPDRYVYRVCCAPAGIDVTAADQQLPDDVRELFERALRQT